MFAKIDQYRRGLDECLARADQSPTLEIRDLWLSIAGSYRCLLSHQELSDARDRDLDALTRSIALENRNRCRGTARPAA
jgi:hypothetical protein